MTSVNEVVAAKLRRADERGETETSLEFMGSPSIGYNGFTACFKKYKQAGWIASFKPCGSWDLASLKMTDAVEKAVREYKR